MVGALRPGQPVRLSEILEKEEVFPAPPEQVPLGVEYRGGGKNLLGLLPGEEVPLILRGGSVKGGETLGLVGIRHGGPEEVVFIVFVLGVQALPPPVGEVTDVEGAGKVAIGIQVPPGGILGGDGGEAEHPHCPGPQGRRQSQKGQGGAGPEGLPARPPKPGCQQCRPCQQDFDNAGSHLPLCRIVEERRVVVLCRLPGYGNVVPEVVEPPEKEQHNKKG